MTTPRVLITQALRLIRITAAGGNPPTAEEMNDGLAVFNQMVSGLESQGVDLGFASLTLDDDFPFEPKFDEAVKYLLAVRLAPEYGVDITPETAILATRGLSFLQSSFTEIPVLRMDKGLRNRRTRFGGDSGTNP